MEARVIDRFQLTCLWNDVIPVRLADIRNFIRGVLLSGVHSLHRHVRQPRNPTRTGKAQDVLVSMPGRDGFIVNRIQGRLFLLCEILGVLFQGGPRFIMLPMRPSEGVRDDIGFR